MPTVGLCMVVRDERESIEACLESARQVIDSWTIVDTGSQDGTREFIAEYLADLPGKRYDRKWLGFAHNRTEAMELAKGTADYHLLMDGDHILHVDGEVHLTADEYLLRLRGGFDQSLSAVLKDGRGWYWKGVAHAALHCDDGLPIDCQELPQWSIEAREDDRDRQEKYVRDALALEGEIDPRTIFYLAQSLKDIGHPIEAADLYRFRIRLSARHTEEVFWACHQEGCLRVENGQFDHGMMVLAEAFERRPSRAEPLYAMARAYRQKGMPTLALILLERAKQISYPADRLFVLRYIYEYGIDLEMAHCLIALGEEEKAREILRGMAEADEPARSYAWNTLASLK